MQKIAVCTVLYICLVGPIETEIEAFDVDSGETHGVPVGFPWSRPLFKTLVAAIMVIYLNCFKLPYVVTLKMDNTVK